jgi:hypothetical protein
LFIKNKNLLQAVEIPFQALTLSLNILGDVEIQIKKLIVEVKNFLNNKFFKKMGNLKLG